VKIISVETGAAAGAVLGNGMNAAVGISLGVGLAVVAAATAAIVILFMRRSHLGSVSHSAHPLQDETNPFSVAPEDTSILVTGHGGISSDGREDGPWRDDAAEI
jgi:hypothetical protein